MPIDKATKTILSKLKKEITELKRKEKSTRNQLRQALAQVKKNSLQFQRALNRSTKETQTKITASENSVYEKIVGSLKKKAKKLKKGR